MLRFIGWTYLIVGILGIMFVGFPALSSGTLAGLATGAGVFFGALLVPALLFALADLVQHTRETRDAVRALVAGSAGLEQMAPPSSGSAWGEAVAAENAARDAREDGARARARRDAGSVGDGSREL